ncbi:type I restriction endonuclease [Catenovulum sediminis]|uniref:Type I restriction endonuclease n=1 Tax=Catenovulum sediminis TaxID=1740262 RepID=A0ABV1RKF1_9ALTE
MDFNEKIATLSKKITQQKSSIQTEEATKNAFVMPFLQMILGYDVFDPSVVVPEFTADTGTKKGEKVDYALLNDDEVQILMECKKYGDKLNVNHASQLFRYFSVTNARLAILTNGSVYQFYTDLDAPNKMDEKPFLEFDFEDVDPHLLPELKKLTRDSFDIDAVINTAGELKYSNQIKKLIDQQFKDPDEDFVKLFASRVYSGILTSKVKEQFTELTKKALTQFLNDKISARLKSALNEDSPRMSTHEEESEELEEDNGIETTEEELEGYHIVRSILRRNVEAERIIYRDTKSYFGILLDDNNRKPLCRLHFNRSQKYIGIFGDNKAETRHAIEHLDDIYKFEDQLNKTLASYE